MDETILVDGEWRACVPADDRGLAYGDGVFRTLVVKDGQPIAWAAHMQRLVHDCARLDLSPPDETPLASDAARLFEDHRSGVLKIIVTRGSGGRGYAPPSTPCSRRILSAHALPAADGPMALALDRSPVVLARQPGLAGVKHLNRLEQVLARDACARADTADAFMCDSDGWVTATTMRNLLFQDKDGRWLTPALAQAGIIGATRQRLIGALAETGIRVHETGIAVSALSRMRAAVACNSVTGPVAVSRMDDVVFADSEAASEYCRKLIQ